MKQIQNGGSQADLPLLTMLSFALFIYVRRYRRPSNLWNIKYEGLGKTFRLKLFFTDFSLLSSSDGR